MEEDKRLENLSYFYKNPNIKKGDPGFGWGKNRMALSGEIVIGKEILSYEDWTNEHMRRCIIKWVMDPSCHKEITRTKEYFGEVNFEPARQKLIEQISEFYLRLCENGVLYTYQS